MGKKMALLKKGIYRGKKKIGAKQTEWKMEKLKEGKKREGNSKEGKKRWKEISNLCFSICAGIILCFWYSLATYQYYTIHISCY